MVGHEDHSQTELELQLYLNRGGRKGSSKNAQDDKYHTTYTNFLVDIIPLDQLCKL